MVNVAGRSKACKTCRKRRVTCGEERPSCRRCQKLGRACGGYAFPRLFVHVNYGVKNEAPPNQGGDGDERTVSRSFQERKQTPAQIHSRTVATFDRDEVYLHPAYRQQLYHYFLTSIFPVDGPARDALTGWYTLVPTIQNPTPALDAAMMALCTVTLGQVRDDKALIRESWRCYCSGLHYLQLALWNPDLMYHDETLASAMALAMYELAGCPGAARAGYVSHVRGLARLVLLRGPIAATSSLGHEIFRLFRVVEALHALEYKQRTFAAEPEWLECAWLGKSKGASDSVIDIILSISNLLSDAADIWVSPRVEHPRPVANLISQYRKLDSQLLVIDGQTRSRFDCKPAFWHVWSTMTSPTDDEIFGKTFPVVYQFPDFSTANMFLLLWTGLMMTRSALEGLSKYLGKDLAASGNEEALKLSADLSLGAMTDNVGDWTSYAHEVCQCAEYFLSGTAAGAARTALSLPLNVVAGYLAADGTHTRELKWVKDMLALVGNSGMRLLLYW